MKRIFVSMVIMVGLVVAQNNTTEPKPFSVKIEKPTHKKALRDLAYDLPIDHNSKFLCEGELKNGEKIYFVSVKAMMLVYLHQDYFKKHKMLNDDITKIYIHDYLSGEKIPAQKAVYVFGSRLIGPHGDDLIPFGSEERAKLFEIKYGGHKILPFERLDKGLMRYLDM